MSFNLKQINKELTILGIIILIALSARLWGIDFGLPYTFHPDEPRYLLSAQLLFKTHSIDPLSLPDLSSSSFVYVINAVAYLPYYLIGKLVGVFQSPNDILAPEMIAMGVGRTALPSTFLLGRFVTALFGIANVALVFLIGKRLFTNANIGLLAALVTALSSTNVSHSQVITPDTFVTFFVLLAFFGTASIYRNEKTIYYIICGIALGCVVSAKISGILAALPLLIVYFYRKGFKGIFNPNVYFMVIAGALSFVATTPYILGNFRDVVGDILSEGHHYSQGHAGMEGNPIQWYLSYMWQTAGLIYILSVLEIIRGLVQRSKEIIILSVYPIAYFIFICSFTVRNDRTLLPITPFLYLLAASFLIFLVGMAVRLQSKVWRTIALSAVLCLSFAALFLPASKTIENNIKLMRKDGRETSRIWIANNLPLGSKIGLESYAPFMEPKNYSLQSSFSMIDHDANWYVENEFDYLVFSQGMYGRYFREPDKYLSQISRYNALFSRFQRMESFTDGDYEVLVYKVQ